MAYNKAFCRYHTDWYDDGGGNNSIRMLSFQSINLTGPAMSVLSSSRQNKPE